MNTISKSMNFIQTRLFVCVKLVFFFEFSELCVYIHMYCVFVSLIFVIFYLFVFHSLLQCKETKTKKRKNEINRIYKQCHFYVGWLTFQIAERKNENKNK